MSEPLTYSARLKAKGLDGTGVTEALAKTMSKRLGKHTLLIVEVEHSRLVTDADGGHQVQLGVVNLEPVPERLEDAVRRFQRAIYLTRPDVAGQAVLQGTADGESPDQAAAALLAAVSVDTEADDWDGDLDAPIPDPVSTDGSLDDPPAGGAALSVVPDADADEEDSTVEVCLFPECVRELDGDGFHSGPHRDRAGHVLGTDVDDEEGP